MTGFLIIIRIQSCRVAIPVWKVVNVHYQNNNLTYEKLAEANNMKIIIIILAEIKIIKYI